MQFHAVGVTHSYSLNLSPPQTTASSLPLMTHSFLVFHAKFSTKKKKRNNSQPQSFSALDQTLWVFWNELALAQTQTLLSFAAWPAAVGQGSCTHIWPWFHPRDFGFLQCGRGGLQQQEPFPSLVPADCLSDITFLGTSAIFVPGYHTNLCFFQTSCGA